MITTTSRIEDKKPSKLILPPMDMLETFPYVRDVDYITRDLAVLSVRSDHEAPLVTKAAILCSLMILGSLKKSKKQIFEDLKPREQDTRRTSGNTTRNDPFPPFLLLEAQTQVIKQVAARSSMDSKMAELKARTTLLMSIPEDHLAKFHKMTDAKEMWEAIKSKFGGNDESKKMHKYILKQQFERFSVSNSEGLHKGYDGFQESLISTCDSWCSVFTEDAYQVVPLVFMLLVPSFSASSSSKQECRRLFLLKAIAYNDVVCYGVSTSSGHNSQREGSSSYTDELKRDGFEMASSHDFHEIEEAFTDTGRREMHGNHWHIKQKDNGRRPRKQEEPKALVTLDGDSVDWTGHAEDEQENFALMAYSNSGST
ncbi:hypothetical protein Tco_0352647 [Tanacetum coccineum]